MPRSKRAKVVHLSKVTKKGKEHSVKTFANVQAAVERYPYLYVFRVDNMRNTHLKDVRVALAADSRVFFGKTRVMAKALGDGAADAPAPGTHALGPYMRGTVGLLASDRDPADAAAFFATFRPADYARAGGIATRDFTIPAGTVYSRAGEIPADEDLPLSHGSEPNLRHLGVPSRLIKGRVELDAPHPVCRRGDTLTSAQTTLLKMFGIATAHFAVDLVACWSKATGQVTKLSDGTGNIDDNEDGGVKISGMDVDDEEEEEEDE